jgi:ribosomal protein S18 acetylase RimI-like enzyme
MQSLPVEIIKLPPEDWRVYRQLRLEALRESPQAFGSTYQDQITRPDQFWISRLEEAQKGQESWLLFARTGGKLVGMIGAYRKEASDGENPAQEVEIIAVYVTLSERGRGLSRLLMSAILGVLRENGIQKAYLGVNENQIPAVRLYQSFGFRKIGTETRLLGDGAYHDEMFMVKDLVNDQEL